MKRLFSQLFKRSVLLCFGLASAFCAHAGVILNVSRVTYEDKTIYIFGERHHRAGNIDKNREQVESMIDKQYEALEYFFEKLKENKTPIALLIECKKSFQVELVAKFKEKSNFRDYFIQFYKELSLNKGKSFINDNIRVINFDKTRQGLVVLKHTVRSILKLCGEKMACIVECYEEKYKEKNEYVSVLDRLYKWESKWPYQYKWNLGELEKYIKKNASYAEKINPNIYDSINELKKYVGESIFYKDYNNIVSFVCEKYDNYKNEPTYFDQFFDLEHEVSKVIVDIDLLKEINEVKENTIVVRCGDYHRQAVVKYLKNEHNATVKTIKVQSSPYFENDLLNLLPTVNEQQTVEKKNNQNALENPGQTNMSWYKKITHYIGWRSLLVAGGIGAALYCYFRYST